MRDLHDTSLIIRNRGGSIQHYYHFLLGALAPLVILLEEDRLNEINSQFFVRSCGPMDRHLELLNYSNLTILNSNDLTSAQKPKHKFINHLYGFDHWDYYDKSIFDQVNSIVKRRLKGNLNNHSKTKQPEVILINRSIDNFYNSEESEIKESGLQRRSIPNFQELESAILKTHPLCYSITLEKLTLVEQIVKFSNAKIIIAQHGASLANLIFANTDTKIIEIIPREKLNVSKYFSELAKILGMNHQFSIQESSHASVDVRDIIYKLSN